VIRKDTITQYHHHELRALIQWIQSDGRLRTDDELIAELVRELGFQKRGSRIEAVCREALRLAKSNGPSDGPPTFAKQPPNHLSSARQTGDRRSSSRRGGPPATRSPPTIGESFRQS
jgi:hypothetical protein